MDKGRGGGERCIQYHVTACLVANLRVATAASGGQQGSRCGRVDLRPVLAKDGRHELLLAPVRHLVEALLTSLLAIALGTAQGKAVKYSCLRQLSAIAAVY